MIEMLPDDWLKALADRLQGVDFETLDRLLVEKRRTPEVYPPPSLVFAALEMTRFADVKAVILGQDPYPNPGEACGLAFSVPRGVPRPLSLRRIFQKVSDDLGVEVPEDATLEPWANNGVLLFNTSLTVEAGHPNSHRGLWAPFTRAVLDVLRCQPRGIAFLLWGAQAQRLGSAIPQPPHTVLKSDHPAARRAASDLRSFASSHPFLDTGDRVNWSLSPR